MRKYTVIAILLVFFATGALFAGGRNQGSTGGGMPTLSPQGLTGDALAFSKFTKPVDVHIGMAVNPIDSSLPRGDTAQNNQYTRYLRDKFNINVIVDWTAASGNDYNEKVALSIASNTLPDGLTTGSMQMRKAAVSGMLYDITDLFNAYASSQVKKIIDSTNGRAKEMVSYNGRMIALPHVAVTTDGIHTMHIQKNWLDQYNLQVPRTINDIENVARVFKDRKPAGARTIPIIGPDKNTKLYSNFLESTNNMNGFDPIFAAFDAYPGYFLDNKNGTASYGSLSPNMKPALELLARWYKEGLIDPEMGTRDQSGEPVNANEAGIRFGPWWGIGYGNNDSFINNPNVNWQAYPVYSADGKWNSPMPASGIFSCLISKKASADTAAAIIMMYNVLTRDEAIFDTGVAIEWYPLRTILAPADECEYTYRELTKVLKGEANPANYNDPMSPYKLLYGDVQEVRSVITGYSPNRELSVKDFNQSNRGNFNRMYSLMIGDRPFATQKVDKAVTSITYAMTDLLEQRWANLKRMEDEIMMKIIIGQLDISAFDKFVSDWLAQGGQAVLNDLATQFLKK